MVPESQDLSRQEKQDLAELFRQDCAAAPKKRSRRHWRWGSRIASVLLVATYVCLAYYDGGLERVYTAVEFSVLPLLCIWFGDWMGGQTGMAGVGVYVSRSSPGCAVVLCGWMFLLLPVIVALISWFR